MNIPRQILFGILTTTLLAAQALAGGRVMFLEPVDGATVASEFTVRMGVEGMTVAPQGSCWRAPATTT